MTELLEDIQKVNELIYLLNNYRDYKAGSQEHLDNVAIIIHHKAEFLAKYGLIMHLKAYQIEDGEWAYTWNDVDKGVALLEDLRTAMVEIDCLLSGQIKRNEMHENKEETDQED